MIRTKLSTPMKSIQVVYHTKKHRPKAVVKV